MLSAAAPTLDIAATTAGALLSADPRLCSSHLPGLAAELICNDGSILKVAVRAASCQDLVLIVPSETECSIGDIVAFRLFENGRLQAEDQSGVVHWKVVQEEAMLIALFTVGRLDDVIDHRLIDDRRLEIRFPTRIPVQLRTGRRLIDGCIVNYSLNGIGLVCREPLALHSSYLAMGASEDTEIRLTVETQWQTETANGILIGCALEAQHGVLLARRTSAEHDPLQCRIVRDIARDLYLPGVDDTPALPTKIDDAAAAAAHCKAQSRWKWLRSGTPLLSAFLIGQSLNSNGSVSQLTLLTGLIGVVASLVFGVLDRSSVPR